MLKKCITNLQLWAKYFWRIAENYYLTLKVSQQKQLFYIGIGIGFLILVVLPVILIISTIKKRAKKNLQMAIPMAKEKQEVLVVKEETGKKAPGEENVEELIASDKEIKQEKKTEEDEEGIEELLVSEEKDIKPEDETLVEIPEQIKEDTKPEPSEKEIIQEQKEEELMPQEAILKGDEKEIIIEDIEDIEDMEDIIQKFPEEENDEELILEDAIETNEKETVEAIPVSKDSEKLIKEKQIESPHVFHVPEGDLKDKFINDVKNDLETEFTSLIKRYFPQKIDFKEKKSVDDEIITKCRSIVRKLNTLEDYNNKFFFSKDYYKAKSLFYFTMEQKDKFLQNIEKAFHHYPREDIFLIQYAHFLINNNKIDEAEKQLLKIKEINPSNLEMYLLLGEIYFKRDKFHESLNMFKKVILLDTKNSNAYAYKGFILANKGYISDGEKDLKKAISLNYQNHLPYYFLGNIFKDLQLYGKAIHMYKKGLKFGGDFIILKENLAFCLMHLKKYDMVIHKLLPEHDKNRLTKNGLIILSTALEAKNKCDRAIEILQRGLEYSKEPQYYYRLGELFEKTGEYEKSIESYKKVTDENLKIAVNIKIADIYLYKIKQYDQAEKYYIAANKKDMNNYKTIHSLAVLYFFKNEYEKSVKFFEQAIDHMDFKISPDIFYKTGVAYNKLQRYGEAIKHLTKAENIGYVDEDLYKNLGFAYIKESKINKAIESYKKSIAINPHNPVLHNNIGVIYAQQGKYTDAIKEFKKALDNDKNNKDALHNLHKAYKILSEKESTEYLSQLKELL